MLSPQLFVQRCQSISLWGEKCVLTFTLKLRSQQELRCVTAQQLIVFRGVVFSGATAQEHAE